MGKNSDHINLQGQIQDFSWGLPNSFNWAHFTASWHLHFVASALCQLEQLPTGPTAPPPSASSPSLPPRMARSSLTVSW